MKKTIFLLSALAFAGAAFSQQKTEVDYVEYGVDESNPASYRVQEIRMPDGSKKNMVFKKKHFKPENLQGCSSTETIYPLAEKLSENGTPVPDTDKLTSVIAKKKENNEYVKEMYEENGAYYLLFHPCPAVKKR